MSNLKRQTATQQNQQETQTKKLQLIQDTLPVVSTANANCKADRTQKQTNIKFVIIGEDYEWIETRRQLMKDKENEAEQCFPPWL